MWTYLLVVCGVVFLTDARECADYSVFFEELRSCASSTNVSEVMSQIDVLVNDGFISQIDFCMLTSALCSWTVPLRSCLSAGFEDCSNYATEMEPLLSGENLICNPNGSASGELEQMVNEFSNLDIQMECSNARKQLSRCHIPKTPPTPILAKDIQKHLERTLYETISCMAEEIQNTDVSACGRKSDVFAMAIVREYFNRGGMLNVPFKYSDYVTADGAIREKKDILRTILGF
ncbi:hypothetical protein ScPMuIL_000958 [Solemya velum]